MATAAFPWRKDHGNIAVSVAIAPAAILDLSAIFPLFDWLHIYLAPQRETGNAPCLTEKLCQAWQHK